MERQASICHTKVYRRALLWVAHSWAVKGQTGQGVTPLRVFGGMFDILGEIDAHRSNHGSHGGGSNGGERSRGALSVGLQRQKSGTALAALGADGGASRHGGGASRAGAAALGAKGRMMTRVYR